MQPSFHLHFGFYSAASPVECCLHCKTPVAMVTVTTWQSKRKWVISFPDVVFFPNRQEMKSKYFKLADFKNNNKNERCLRTRERSELRAFISLRMYKKQHAIRFHEDGSVVYLLLFIYLIFIKCTIQCSKANRLVSLFFPGGCVLI